MKIFTCMFMHIICMWVRGGQKMLSDALEPDLQEVLTSHLMWVLGSKLKEQQDFLTETISTAPLCYFSFSKTVLITDLKVWTKYQVGT